MKTGYRIALHILIYLVALTIVAPIRGAHLPIARHTSMPAFFPAAAPAAPTNRLLLERTTSATTITAGETITCTLTLSTTVEATVSLTETLPVGLINIQSADALSYDEQQHQIHYIGILQPGHPLTLTYSATVDATIAPGSILYSAAELTGAGPPAEAAAAVAVVDPAVEHTLVLLYASGDNNLRDSTLTLLNRLEQAADTPHATILMLIDGSTQGDALLYRVQPDEDMTCPHAQNPTCNGRYTVGQNMWTWGENVAHADSLAAFVQGALLAYPHARQTALVLMGHGSGWWANPEAGAEDGPAQLHGFIPQPRGHARKPGGLLLDETPGDSLSTAELGDALRWATQAAGRRIDLIYLDACLMSTAEVAYELRDSADYLLASENINWTAMPYQQHIQAVTADIGAEALGLAWLHHEQDVLAPDYPYTYSLIELAALDDVRAAVEQLAAALLGRLPQDRAQIAAAFASSALFDSDGNLSLDKGSDNLVDLASFARQVQQQFGSSSTIVGAAQAVQDAIAAAVVATAYNTSAPWLFDQWAWDNLGGLSIYAPLNQDDWKRGFAGQSRFVQQGAASWKTFLDAYWGYAPAPAPCRTDAACNTSPHPLVLDVTNELYANDYDFWIMPDVVRVGKPAQIGLFVHRQGGKTVYEQVPVRFMRDTPTGPLLGESSVPFLDPASDVDSTLPLKVTFNAPGIYSLYASIDPANRYAEDIETNNIILGRVNVLPPADDQSAPTIQSVQVNQGAAKTTERTVTLTIDATDAAAGPGAARARVEAVAITEYVYNQRAERWIPVQHSDWLPYHATAPYPWQLRPFAGMRYLLVRARDYAGNISLQPASSMINYQPGPEPLSRGQRQIYRYNVAAGQQLTVDLEVLRGDADLYVWSSSQQASAYVSNRASGDERVVVPAAAVVPGIYQIEIYGYARAEYRLRVTTAATHASTSALLPGGHPADSKPPLERPLLPVDSVPREPRLLASSVYLPHVRR